MQQINLSIFLLVGIFGIWSCESNNELSANAPKDPPLNEKVISLKIQENNTYQIIENFGASDAWATQFIGKWPDQKRNEIADLLFSTQKDEKGNPIGIGLSLWRFNLGAGSASQGAASGISDPWRRGESFIVPESGNYDWNKMQGQVWFAKAARSRGVEKLLLFTNSPPITITRNGKAFTSDANQSNLAPKNYDEFASYLADVVEGLALKGLEVDYVSPVNEPQWDWTGGQEGTPFWNHEIAGIVKSLNAELLNRNLSPEIDISEAGQLNFLYEEGGKPGRANQIQEFFDPSAENYIGDLEKLGHSISGHSYFTTSPYSSMTSVRKELNSEIERVPDLNYWMSEYCILGDNNGEIEGNGRDLGINPALYMARVIHSDLTVANASAWHWWTAISAYDYKDGLVYVDKNEENGDFYDSKMLWALGNYSRFIRPGYKRFEISSSDSSNEDLLLSAYKNPETSEKIIVIVNSKFSEVLVELEGVAASSIETYVTSSEKDLEKSDLSAEGVINIPERSIVTLLMK